MNKKYVSYIRPEFFSEPTKTPIRNGFGDGLVSAGDANEEVVALCCDLVDSTKTADFANAYSNRFIEMGIAEQNMAGVGAGMALGGKIPFITSYAVFCPGRNWDQIRVSICYTNANVKIVGSHAGVSVGPDGATHQALEDIAITRVLPNMTVVVPADATEAKKATEALAEHVGPAYIRLARAATADVFTDKVPFEIGKAHVLRSGSDMSIIACGSMVGQVLFAAEQLFEKGIDAEVINMSTIKPFDKKTVGLSIEKTKKIVTVEEHQVAGGLGSVVAEFASGIGGYPVLRIGIDDHFGESGEPDELWNAYGLSVDAIVEKILHWK